MGGVRCLSLIGTEAWRGRQTSDQDSKSADGVVGARDASTHARTHAFLRSSQPTHSTHMRTEQLLRLLGGVLSSQVVCAKSQVARPFVVETLRLQRAREAQLDDGQERI